MKWILILASAYLVQAKEITTSGDSSVHKSTESLLQSADKIAIKDENGHVVAYKLGKIQKNSTLAKLGLKTGDILSMPKSKDMVLESKLEDVKKE